MDHPNFLTRRLTIGCIVVLLGLVLAACGPEALGLPAGNETETPTMMPIPPGATTAPYVTLNVSSNAALGSFLTDQTGFTLYTFKQDTAGVSRCTGTCMTTWPPLMTSAPPKAGSSAIKGKVGIINRPDGGQQVTYNGLPLYFYNKDAIPGNIFGQGVSSDWSAASP